MRYSQYINKQQNITGILWQGRFFKSSLSPARTRFKEIAKWVKSGFLIIILIYAKISFNFVVSNHISKSLSKST
jgi:hypothetical protein